MEKFVVYQWDGPHGGDPSDIIAVFDDEQSAKEFADSLDVDTGYASYERVAYNPPKGWNPYD